LSKSQKLLLIAGYCASCNHESTDEKIFKAKKFTGRKLRSIQVCGSLRGITNSFVLNRLFSIYSCIKDIIEDYITPPIINLELIADVNIFLFKDKKVNSLVSLNLLKYISKNETNIYTRKMISNLNLETVKELAFDCDEFKVEEFLVMD